MLSLLFVYAATQINKFDSCVVFRTIYVSLRFLFCGYVFLICIGEFHVTYFSCIIIMFIATTCFTGFGFPFCSSCVHVARFLVKIQPFFLFCYCVCFFVFVKTLFAACFLNSETRKKQKRSFRRFLLLLHIR